MSKKSYVRYAVAAALAAASASSNVAFAVYEAEPNEPIPSAQRAMISSGGGAQLTAVLGVLSGPPTNDVDFYSFEGIEGDVVTLDIDGGAKPAGSGTRSVDTVMAIFGPGPTFTKLRENDDGFPLDPGSSAPLDSRIEKFRLPASGTYTVGVSSFPRFFRHGGTLTSSSLGSLSNGSYTLLVTGVTPSSLQVNIEIKPGSDEIAPINPKSKGNIPVALLTQADFDALLVDRSSITFGAKGTEASLRRCSKEGEDVDGDGDLDLVCHFYTQKTGFEPGDLEGVVMGRAGDGRSFEGRGLLKVVPAKRRY